MSSFISSTGALLDAATASNGSPFVIVLYIVALVAMFYFVLYRPQQKEKKKQQALMASMAVGDYVCTTSGFYGNIIDIQDDTVIVEFGSNKNCRIPMKKSAIVEVEKA